MLILALSAGAGVLVTRGARASLRRVVRGEPTLLVYRGEYLRDALRSQRVTESEIRQAARSQSVADLRGSAVVLETDGKFSVLPVVDSANTSTLDGLFEKGTAH